LRVHCALELPHLTEDEIVHRLRHAGSERHVRFLVRAEQPVVHDSDVRAAESQVVLAL